MFAGEFPREANVDGARGCGPAPFLGPVVRASVSRLRVPPRLPELNPVETIFSALNRRHFSNRLFESAEHVGEVEEEVRDGFTQRTAEIMQITRLARAEPCKPQRIP